MKKSPEKKKEQGPMGGGIAAILKMADKNASMKGKLTLASDVTEDYIDFVDLTVPGGRPCLLLEYLFSCRGLSTGRVLKIDAEEATGKSSLSYLLYGMGQRSNAYVVNHETERAVMPPDRIARLGCRPEQLLLYRPGDVDDCLNATERFIVQIRELDKAKTSAIYVGIDSVSSLPGTECDPETGEPLDPKGKGLGYHARRFSEFFRDKLQFFAQNRVVLIGTGQHKTGFTTLPGGRQMASGKTSLAEGAFKFHASWIVTMRSMKSDVPGAETLVCRSTKNKMGPKHREVALRLFNDERGWDFNPGTASLLFSSFSPFDEKLKGEKGKGWGSGGGMYWHPQINGGSGTRAKEFVDEFLQNQELLMQVRETWKIRGFGFKFEQLEPPEQQQERPDAEPE